MSFVHHFRVMSEGGGGRCRRQRGFLLFVKLCDTIFFNHLIESGLVASSEVGDDVISFPLQVRHVVVGVEGVGEGGEVSEGGGSVGGGLGRGVGGGGGGFVVVVGGDGA